MLFEISVGILTLWGVTFFGGVILTCSLFALEVEAPSLPRSMRGLDVLAFGSFSLEEDFTGVLLVMLLRLNGALVGEAEAFRFLGDVLTDDRPRSGRLDGRFLDVPEDWALDPLLETVSADSLFDFLTTELLPVRL